MTSLPLWIFSDNCRYDKFPGSRFWIPITFDCKQKRCVNLKTFPKATSTEQQMLLSEMIPDKPLLERFNITEAAPDDPIYTRGYVIGGHYSGRRILDKRDKEANAENNEEVEGKITRWTQE